MQLLAWRLKAFLFRRLKLYILEFSDALFDWQGVCIGLSEVMASAGRSQLLSFMDELIPTIRTALCDRFVIYKFLLRPNGFLTCSHQHSMRRVA